MEDQVEKVGGRWRAVPAGNSASQPQPPCCPHCVNACTCLRVHVRRRRWGKKRKEKRKKKRAREKPRTPMPYRTPCPDMLPLLRRLNGLILDGLDVRLVRRLRQRRLRHPPSYTKHGCLPCRFGSPRSEPPPHPACDLVRYPGGLFVFVGLQELRGPLHPPDGRGGSLRRELGCRSQV